MRDYFYNGHTRLDWGFGNPNVTGSLIALIMTAAWMLAYLPRGWGKAGFGIALAVNAVLGVCLVQTFSRGACVSCVAGAVVLLGYAPRPWPLGRTITIAILSTGLIFYAIHLGFSERTLHGISGGDKSITNRWLIYKVIPRMTWDAPGGWGIGRGGDAFRHWYQPFGRTETYNHLVNSHATWLVEWPWHLRSIYCFAWTSVFLLCMPTASMRFSPPLAIWVGFGLGACFTTIAHNWQLWVLPGMSFILLILVRLILKSWPRRIHLKRAGTAMALFTLTWWAWALSTPSSVHLDNGVVVVSGMEPKTTALVLGLDETVMGKFYGHRIRERCATEPLQVSMRWTAGTTSLPMVDVIVLAGNVTEQFNIEPSLFPTKVKRWLLLNPDKPSSSLLQLIDVDRPSPVTIQIGSFAGGSARNLWRALAAKHPNQIQIEEITGSGRFLRDWSRASF